MNNLEANILKGVNMSKLTPEERKKIYEEEKVRLEAQKENKANFWSH